VVCERANTDSVVDLHLETRETCLYMLLCTIQIPSTRKFGVKSVAMEAIRRSWLTNELYQEMPRPNGCKIRNLAEEISTIFHSTWSFVVDTCGQLGRRGEVLLTSPAFAPLVGLVSGRLVRKMLTLRRRVANRPASW
jgi:hypothetical protein